LLLLSCAKEKSNQFKVVDHFTQKPVPNFIMSFEVCTGSGGGWLFGSCEHNKYPSVSDQDGNFILDITKDDKEGSFNLENYYPQGDSNATNYKYYGDFGGINMMNHTLEVLPAGVVKLYHPYHANKNTITDTIIIRVNNQEQTICKANYNSQKIIYLIPHTTYSLDLTYIKNGVQTKKNIIYTVPPAFHNNPDYWASIIYNVPEM